MSAPVFIDIDWDFLPAGPPAGAQLRWTDPETGKRYRVPDWCYRPPVAPSETKGSFVCMQEWNTIIGAARRYGLDLSALYGLRADRGCPGVNGLLSTLKRRFNPAAPLHVADSHAHALVALRQLAPPGGARVIHFDAHHDLGYNTMTLEDDEYRANRRCWRSLSFRPGARPPCSCSFTSPACSARCTRTVGCR